MQAPGGPQEDLSNNFSYGGWIAPYTDEISAKMMRKIMEPADLMLGRKTFDIWEPYWPQYAQNWPGINEVTKYVLSTTKNCSDWENCVFISSVDEIITLKNNGHTGIKVWGSSELVQLLLQHGLVDEFWLMIHPLVLGKGKRLFGDDAIPSAFKLSNSTTTSTGVIMANYQREGAVKTGTV
jgi:dihydrofolate reductase